MDAEAYLHRQIEDGIRRIADHPGRTAEEYSVARLMAEIHGAAAALVASGSLDRDAMRRVMQEFEAILIGEGLLRKVEAAGEEDVRVVVVPHAAASSESERAPLHEPPSAVLHRVVPVVEEVGTIDDKRVVLVSLDIWSDHFDVRSAMLFPHHLSTHAPGPRPLWEAWDDAGTTYRSEGWSGGARKQWVLRHDGFRPAPPPEASEVTLALMRSDGRQVGERTVTLKRRSATRRSR